MNNRPEARWAYMSDNKDIQGQLSEVYEDQPETPQEYEIDPETLKKMWENLQKSARIMDAAIKAQQKIWGIKD